MSGDFLDTLEVKQMLKCDGCGQYHPVEDCEVVVIRLVKGKKCSIENQRVSEYAPATPDLREKKKENVLDRELPDARFPTAKAETEDKPKRVPLPDGVGYEPLPEELPKNRKNILPAGLGSLMIDPGHPAFEAKGAKETRRV